MVDSSFMLLYKVSLTLQKRIGQAALSTRETLMKLRRLCTATFLSIDISLAVAIIAVCYAHLALNSACDTPERRACLLDSDGR